jgi:acyl carrier protein phosphodiesterase
MHMNWLAHLHLSPNDVEFRLGNVIADFVKGEARLQLPSAVKRGTDCHLFIDACTDAHPIFKHSRQRISPPRRKFASILVDIFYDHFLASRWAEFSAELLDDFATDIYRDFINYTADQVPAARHFVQHMAQGDWLREYVSVEGVERTLMRVSRRLGRPNLLVPMLDELKNNYAELNDDFSAFYPQLRASVANWLAANR